MSTVAKPPIGNAEITPEQLADIAKFEAQLALYHSGELDPDVFRMFRLTNGIFGQLQEGDIQMVRIKVPAGMLTADQLEMIGYLAETYSRGWAHITTRLNVQLHFVKLDDVPEIMRCLASVGLTTREAGGDTLRNVKGCHLAGACPHEVLDITGWAKATFQHFLRNPIIQRLPRKFNISYSGCATDCGQAMFNDIGIIAVTRPAADNSAADNPDANPAADNTSADNTSADNTAERGFRVYLGGGLGPNPHPAIALEDFTPREELLPTLEAYVRVFDHHGNRDNRLRARSKWLIDTLGIDELRRRVFRERRYLLASTTWPGGIPEAVLERGDEPAGAGPEPTPMYQGIPVTLHHTGSRESGQTGSGESGKAANADAASDGNRPDSSQPKSPDAAYRLWSETNAVRGVANGTVSAYAWARLGDITARQFRALAAIVRDFQAEIRTTNRQNLVLRNLSESQLPDLFARLSEIGMAAPGAELAHDVVACPGTETCVLAVTQSRGLADAVSVRLEEEGLGELGGVLTNISGCPNSCGQHHAFDIGLFGAERRVNNQSLPGYQLMLGGYVGQEKIHFAERALRLPAKNAPEAVVRVVRRFAEERQPGEPFRKWLKRSGDAKGVGETLKDLDAAPPPEETSDFYEDFGEIRPANV